MSLYLDRYLTTQEKLVYRTGLHWIVFSPALFFSLAFVIVVNVQKLDGIMLFASVVVSLGLWVYAYLRFLTTDFVITNQRILVKVGWVRVRVAELSLGRVEGVRVEQSILGRIFDYGSIIVTGVGGSYNGLESVDQPKAFSQALQSLVSNTSTQ